MLLISTRWMLAVMPDCSNKNTWRLSLHTEQREGMDSDELLSDWEEGKCRYIQPDSNYRLLDKKAQVKVFVVEKGDSFNMSITISITLWQPSMRCMDHRKMLYLQCFWINWKMLYFIRNWILLAENSLLSKNQMANHYWMGVLHENIMQSVVHRAAAKQKLQKLCELAGLCTWT